MEITLAAHMGTTADIPAGHLETAVIRAARAGRAMAPAVPAPVAPDPRARLSAARPLRQAVRTEVDRPAANRDSAVAAGRLQLSGRVDSPRQCADQYPSAGRAEASRGPAAVRTNIKPGPAVATVPATRREIRGGTALNTGAVPTTHQIGVGGARFSAEVAERRWAVKCEVGEDRAAPLGGGIDPWVAARCKNEFVRIRSGK